MFIDWGLLMQDAGAGRVIQRERLYLAPMRVGFLVLFLCSSGLLLALPVPVTNSGVIAVFGSDLIAIPVIVAVMARFLRRRHMLSPLVKAFLCILLIFFLYCGAVFAFRYAGGEADLQSLVIPRANLPAAAMLLLLLTGLFTAKDVVLTAFIFSTTLSIFAIPLSLYEAYLPFSVFENLAIRTDLQLFLSPLLLGGIVIFRTTKRPWLLVWLLAFNLFSLLFTATVSGARVNAILVPVLLVAATAVLMLAFPRRAKLLRFGIAVVVPLVAAAAVIALIAPHSERVQYGIERNILVTAVSDLLGGTTGPQHTNLDSPHVGSSSPPDDGALPLPTVSSSPTNTAEQEVPPSEVEQQAETSLEASSASRAEVWAKAWIQFTNNPLFGTGLKQYATKYTVGDATYTSIIQPHNFFIEYLMSYGVIGLVLWLAVLLFWPVTVTRTTLRQRIRGGRAIAFLTALTFVFVFGASFFQPLMLYPDILLSIYFAIGSFAVIMKQASPDAAGVDQSLGRVTLNELD